MEGLTAGIVEVAGSFRPATMKNMPVDLDKIAKKGREIIYLSELKAADGRFHPSSLASPCLKKDVIERIILELIAKKNKSKEPVLLAIRAKYGSDEALKKAIRSQQFDYKGQRAMDVGTAFHEMEQQKYFGPSGLVVGHWACSNCHRKLTKELKPMPTKPCTNVVNVLGATGTLVRTLPCKKHGTWKYKELHLIHAQLNISMRIDLIVDCSDYRVVVDIKSVGNGMWDRLTEPSPKDVIQLQIYMLMMDAQYGILRYVLKGDQSVNPKHFALVQDPKVKPWLNDYIGTVNKLVKERRWEDLVGVCNKKTQVRAKRCPFNFLCF